MPEPSMTFDGAPVPFQAGQSVAAALTDAGHRVFRRTATGAGRGMFCGMGVCQDCLLTVNGVPNCRACMTAAAPGLDLRTQDPFPELSPAAVATDEAADPPLVIDAEVLVIGGGAGGLSAAMTAAAAGARVTVLDERKVPGGQYFKQAAAAPPLDAQQRQGADLLAAARQAGAQILGGVEIWGAFDGLMFLGTRDGRAVVARPRAAIVATGAYERPVMVPGWTLPGVMTTGAAQTLWRSYRTLPGRRVAFCGSGPLNLQVALELAAGGAEVALVAEAATSPARRLRAAAAMAAADPRLTLKGLGMLAALRRARVAVLRGARLTEVVARDGALRAGFDVAGQRHVVTVDALCMNAGFEPQNEILRLLGAGMDYDASMGHLRCRRGEDMQTTVPGLFAVGDCAGLGGAPAAMAEGRIAGRAAAALAGHGDGYDQFLDRRELRRHRRFQRALWQLHDIAPADLSAADSATTLCRCEEVTLGTVTAEMQTRPGHAGTLKRATRLGMGRCQGRYCAAAAARLVARATGRPMEDRSLFAPRVPIKPVSIAAILAAQDALDGAE